MSRVEIEKEYWDKEADNPDIDSRICDSGLVEPCLEALSGHIEGEKILEIGSGVGRLLNELVKLDEFKDTRFCGIDISEKIIGIARERKPKKSKINYKLCDGRKIPYVKEVFDSVFSVAVFQHLDTDGLKEYLKEMNRVLKPLGIIRIQLVEGDEKTAFSYQYSIKEIEELLSEFNFKICSCDRGLVYPNWVWITAEKLYEKNTD